MIWSKTVQSKITKEGLNKSILQQSTSWLCHGGQATERLSFAELEHGSKKLWTRREVFPGKMDGLIPWDRLEVRIDHFHPKAGEHAAVRGRGAGNRDTGSRNAGGHEENWDAEATERSQ